MQTQETAIDSVIKSVREFYGNIASRGGGCGCGPISCGPLGKFTERDAEAVSRVLGYSAEDLHGVPEGANLGLCCGNPLAIASLRPGQTVLDLGSGAGFDAFLAARAVGLEGRVIGVDMTPEMVAKARQHKAKGGYANVEIRLGEIENLPVADGSMDVVISNCVINLSPDKKRVFREAFRVLRPGGRLAVADIVALAPVPESVRNDVELYTACGAGAAHVDDVTAMLGEAGFRDARVAVNPQSRAVIREWFPGRGLENYFASATIEAVKPDAP